jgi:hypothetical protein
MLAMSNEVSATGVFPSGGSKPWTRIEDYISPGGVPYGPQTQGLSWAYQILPNMEESADHRKHTTTQLQNTPVTMYNCPSRRGATRHETTLAYLTDYAAVVPAESRSQLGDPQFNRYLQYMSGYDDTFGCEKREFWGAPNAPRLDFYSKKDLGAPYRGLWGVIVRGDLWVDDSGARHTTNFYTKISYKSITDGTSKTLVISEKRLAPSRYLVGDWHDDRGWSDGWDPDTLRSTICSFGPDQELKLNNSVETDLAGYRLGSAHPSGMSSGFADGSTRFLSFDIDMELLNRLAHRSDGEIANLPQ